MRICFFIVAASLAAVVYSDATRNSHYSTSGKDVENSWISDFTDRIIHWLKHHRKSIGKQCFDKKKKRILPSAAHLDSPLKTFGYPYFNEKAREAVVRAETPLSTIAGFAQPVKIGSRDYVIVGYPDELLAFCACFEDYEVIGSSLNEEGHWIPNTGSIKIQMQNINSFIKLSATYFEMLFKYTFARIIKYLNPTRIIKELDCQMLGGCDAATTVKKFVKALAKIKEWLPGSEVVMGKLIAIFNTKVPLQQKIKAFITFIDDIDKRQSGIRKQWIGWDNVSTMVKKIIVTLTMYAKPEHRARSTYHMGNATVLMRDIGEAIKVALDKK